MPPSDATLGHVLLVEPNPALRSAILAVLDAERYQVEACESLEHVLVRQDGRARVIALVAWQSMAGLLRAWYSGRGVRAELLSPA